VNVLDAFLGPLSPRMQLEVYDINVDGEIINGGIKPSFSAASKDSLGVTGGLKVRQSFFNSMVQSLEPILEPWALTYVVRKQESDGFLDVLVKGDALNLNVSSSCLQTVAAIVLQVIGSASSQRSLDAGGAARPRMSFLDKSASQSLAPTRGKRRLSLDNSGVSPVVLLLVLSLSLSLI
jgi:hypothetical protein